MGGVILEHAELKYMEDVNSMTSELTTLVVEHLHAKGIEVQVTEEDKLWDVLQEILEVVAGYPDYKNHN
jgi:hypothetical protein